MSETKKLVPSKHLHLTRLSLSFQQYEVDLILNVLNETRYRKLSRCPWVKQESGGYGWKPSREVKQLQFIEKSIRRQLSDLNAKSLSVGTTEQPCTPPTK